MKKKKNNQKEKVGCDNKKIENESFKTFLGRMQKIFEIHNGKVSKANFVDALSSVAPIYARKVFNKLDANNIGHVSIKTLYNWITFVKKDNDYGSKRIEIALSNRD